MHDTETWKAIPGYEGAYEVSDHGRVRSLDRIVIMRNGRRRPYKGRIRSANKQTPGYLAVHLCTGSARKSCQIHQLVAEAFIGPRPGKHDVNHKDGNKHNNHVSNLEYLSRSENQLHAFRVLDRSRIVAVGERCHKAKLTESDVREIRSSSEMASALAAKYGVNSTAIYAVRNGQTWRHIL